MEARATTGEPDLHRSGVEHVGDVVGRLASVLLEWEWDRAPEHVQIRRNGDVRSLWGHQKVR